MPKDQECEATGWHLEARFRLTGFALDVDGTVVKFEDAPRNIPETILFT
jgi:hypothetical protein